MLMRSLTRSWFRFNARSGNLLALQRGWLSRFTAAPRPRLISKKRSYQLMLESLEDIAVPGSTASILANASISVFGYELLNLHPDSSATWIKDAASSAELLEAVSSSATPPTDVTLDDYWQQAIASSIGASVNDMDAPDHAEAAAAGASAAPALRSSLIGLDLSNTLAQGFGDPFSLPAAAPSGSGHGGGSGAGHLDNGSSRGAAGAATEDGAAPASTSSGHGDGSGAGLLDNSSAGGATGGGAAGAGTGGGSTASAASAVGSRATAPQARTRTFAPGTTLSQVNLQAWSQSLHGQNAGHQGLAGSSMLDPSALNRHTGAGTAVTRHTGAPFASLSHGGAAGLGFGVASPSPGKAGLALSAIADQAAAHVADTRGTLTSAMQHAGLIAQTTDSPAGNLAASASSALSVLPALRGAGAATPGSTHMSTPTAHRSLLAEHLAATPVHVHDPETFTDSDNGSSSFTLTGQGSDSTGSFTLTETGSVSSTWSENGNDTTDNWTFTETGSFTVTLTYTNGITRTSTVPINVQQSSTSGATAPTGFDLDGYNQSQIYGAGSVATYTITASGSETYSANDTGTITDDQGDSFTFTVGDHGGDGFSEHDGGNDTPNSSGGDNTSGTFNDSDNGSETDTTTVTGTLAGGGSINYSDTDTSGYTDSDQGNDSKTGGTDSGNDNFNDNVTGSDSPSGTITEPVSDSASGFSGTVTYTDTANNSYNDGDTGNASDNAGSESGTDNFNDSDNGSDDTTVSVTGSVSDPTSGFSGTIGYSDRESGSYHDHDSGPETETAGAMTDTDNFNDGDNGSETITQTASGRINAPDGSFTGTMSFSDTSGGTYSDSDIGAMTDSSNGSETGTDNYVDTDSGSDNLTYTVGGAIADPASGFSGTANFSDTAGGSYHDSDQGPDTETAAGESGTDNFDTGDNGNETVTESVSGRVNAPDGSFVGTVGDSETTTGSYHDSDIGNANEAANGAATGADNFDYGDGGGDTTTVTANGTIDGTATVNVSDTVGDTYSEDDGGSDTEAATGETEQDTYTGDDNGHDDFSYTAAGTLPGTDTTFSDSDTSHDLYDTADSDTGSETANTDSDTVTTDDNVNDGWTQYTDYGDAESDTTTSTVTQNDHAANGTASVNGRAMSSSTAGTRDTDGANWRDVDTNYNMNGAVTRQRTFTSNWQDTKVVSAAGTAETVTDLDTARYVVHGRLSVSFDTTNNWQTAANGTLVNFNYHSIETDYGTDGSYSTWDYQQVWDGSEYVETETDTFTDAQGNTRPIEPPQVTEEPGAPPSGVGEPGFWESMIPIWGSGRSAIANFQQGNYGWAAFHGVMAVSDVFLVKSLVTAATKGAVKVGGKVLAKRAAAPAGEFLGEVDKALLGQLRQGTDFVLPKGTTGISTLMADLTTVSGNEVALLRLKDGTRVLRMGGPKTVRLGKGVKRVIAHTHPSGTLKFSGADIKALQKLKQRSSVLIDPRVPMAVRLSVP